MMMPWLLKNEGYPPAVVVAVLLHAILLYVIFEREMSPAEFIKIEQPATVMATTVQQNPQRLKRLETLELQRQQQQQRADQQRRREEQRVQEQRQQQQREAQQQEAARQQRVAEQRQREEAEQKTREEQQRQAQAQAAAQEQARAEQQRQEQLRQQQAAQEQAAREQTARDEAARQAVQAQALTEEQQLVAQYVAIIHDLITQNWRLPPGARNGMQAMVELRVTPTGEIISSNIIQSSGDALFDRSVLQAVERVGSFPELKDVPNAVFERNFRRFNLLFQPEDLLR